jgi:hypothetical protein
MMKDSARAVNEALRSTVDTGRESSFTATSDPPSPMRRQGAYDHRQMKLALKLASHAIADNDAGPVTRGIRMRKR